MKEKINASGKVSGGIDETRKVSEESHHDYTPFNFNKTIKTIDDQTGEEVATQINVKGSINTTTTNRTESINMKGDSLGDLIL